ncbi:hypothetical protein D5R81_17095 [Parashewanella spongiae]|uniref:RNA ligase domain-containing protein n=1 Tax=Parashewanella spongiae TaxID=342950 RepID=A0A3A6TIN9_9GAMM|nr:RNA ligase family protein [Parashewanella spongiae]MCL1079844.1 RNA ligase family protein [Parashewanella spongiae]RJY06842.1 hypothetical protein D5R81_17095 [Parashewanella spongiae]
MAAIDVQTNQLLTSSSEPFKFKSFPSIPRSQDLAPLLELEGVLASKIWVVTEKVDGANLSYWYSSHNGISHASRNGWIKPSAKLKEVDQQNQSASGSKTNVEDKLGVETFSIHLDYDRKIKDLFEELQKDKPQLVKPDSVLVVYGEYAGPNSPGSFVSITEDGRYCDSRHAAELKPIASGDKTSVTQYRIPYVNNEFYAFKVCIDGKPLDFDTMETYLEKVRIPCVKTITRLNSLQEALNYDTKRIATRHEVSQKVGDRPVVVSDTKLNTLCPSAKSFEAETIPLDIQTEGIVTWDKDYGVLVVGNHSYDLVFKKKTDLHKEKGDKIGEVKSKLSVPENIKDEVREIRGGMTSEGAKEFILKNKKDDSMTMEARRKNYTKLRTGYIQSEIIGFIQDRADSQLAKQINDSDKEQLEKNSKKYIRYFLTQAQVILSDSVLDSLFSKENV